MACFTAPENVPAQVIAGKIAATRLCGGDLERLRTVVRKYTDIRELQQLSQTPLELSIRRKYHLAGQNVPAEELAVARQRDWASFVCWLWAEEPRRDQEFEAATAWLWQ